MNEAGEALRAHATEVYDAITAHKRVEGRLGGSKKPTQLDMSLATLDVFYVEKSFKEKFSKNCEAKFDMNCLTLGLQVLLGQAAKSVLPLIIRVRPL